MHTSGWSVATKAAKRRKRQRHAGIVIDSVQERLWLVKWDQTREESEHAANKLRLEGEASEAQKAAARLARVEQQPAPTARVEQQPGAPTAGAAPPVPEYGEEDGEEANPAATTGAEHVPPPGEDGKKPPQPKEMEKKPPQPKEMEKKPTQIESRQMIALILLKISICLMRRT